MPNDRVKDWIKPSQRGRTRGAWVYIDGRTWDDAMLSVPSIKKAGIKDPVDLPKGYIKDVRVRRHTMSPGKVILTLRFEMDIKDYDKLED